MVHVRTKSIDKNRIPFDSFNRLENSKESLRYARRGGLYNFIRITSFPFGLRKVLQARVSVSLFWSSFMLLAFKFESNGSNNINCV
jgi:hypothetical protein